MADAFGKAFSLQGRGQVMELLDACSESFRDRRGLHEVEGTFACLKATDTAG